MTRVIVAVLNAAGRLGGLVLDISETRRVRRHCLRGKTHRPSPLTTPPCCEHCGWALPGPDDAR